MNDDSICCVSSTDLQDCGLWQQKRKLLPEKGGWMGMLH